MLPTAVASEPLEWPTLSNYTHQSIYPSTHLSAHQYISLRPHLLLQREGDGDIVGFRLEHLDPVPRTQRHLS
jgi:hypothetical protein